MTAEPADGQMSGGIAAEHRPHIELLRETLDFAVERIPWYRERRAVYSEPITSREDLARLPIVERATVRADPRAFASSDELPSAVAFSSGTTGGMGQPRWHNAAEQDVLVAMLERGAPEGTTLVIHPYDQGPAFVPDGAGKRVHAALFVPWHYERILELLTEGWRSTAGTADRIRAVSGFSPGLRVLTAWLDQRGIDPRSFGVQVLSGAGSFQPGPWRRRLELAWGAPYVDMYGMTDISLSDAAQCPLCGARHFRGPVIPEVVDLATRRPVREGTGALLLTELYPFAQLQVFIRYWTDDVVEIARPCPLGGFGVRLLGRRTASAVVEVAGPDAPPLVVGSLPVAEACAELPDIAVGSIPWAPFAVDAGTPQFALRADTGSVLVDVELRYSPDLFPARTTQVVDELRDALLGDVTGLADAVAGGKVRLVIEAVGPGQLGERARV